MSQCNSTHPVGRPAARRSVPFTRSLTLASVADRCCRGASRSTRDIAHALLRHAELFARHPVLVCECSYPFCRRLAGYMLRQGLSDGTVRTYLERLGVLLRSVRGWHAPDVAPLLPPRPRSHKRVIASAEAHRLRASAEADPACAAAGSAFFFALQTGLRFVDIAQLDWSHIRRHPDGYSLCKPMQKTGRLLEIGLNGSACRLLCEQLGADTLSRMPRSGRVFKALPSYSTALRQLKRLGEASGIGLEGLTYHVARHTFASELYRHKVPLATISKFLGHSSISVTENYIQSFRHDEARALALMDNF